MRACYPEDWKKEQLYSSLSTGDVRQTYGLKVENESKFVQQTFNMPYVTFKNGMQTLTDSIEKLIQTPTTMDSLLLANLESHGFQNDEIKGLERNSYGSTSLFTRIDVTPACECACVCWDHRGAGVSNCDVVCCVCQGMCCVPTHKFF